MLVHPKRLANEGLLEAIYNAMGFFASTALKYSLQDLTLTKGQAAHVSNCLENINKIAKKPLSIGELNQLLSPMRFFETDGRYFEVSEPLNDQLIHTDIGRLAPANYFRPPFESIYLYLAKADKSLKVINEHTGVITPLEGVYITEITPNHIADIEALRQHENDSSGSHRVYELTFVGEFQASARSCDIMYARLVIPELWEDTPLQEVIERGFSASIKSKITDLSEDGFIFLKNLVAHVAKVFLYIASEESLMEELNELDDLEEKIKRVKASKQTKLLKRLPRTYNFIRIGGGFKSEDVTANTPGTSVKNKVSTHWRRGHFRNQAFGEGRSKRKLIFIKPTLIGTVGEAQHKTYKVR